MRSGTDVIRSGSSLDCALTTTVVKRSHGYKRRGFLQALGSAALVSLAPGVSSGSSGNPGVQADAEFLSPPVTETLLRMLRLLFPHDEIDDLPYISVVRTIMQMASAKPDLFAVLNAGVRELDGVQSQPWLKLSQTKQLEALALLEPSQFFQTVRVTGRFLFYGNKEVWPYFGYEGSSYEHGGYLNRGFNDLDWLPEPGD